MLNRNRNAVSIIGDVRRLLPSNNYQTPISASVDFISARLCEMDHIRRNLYIYFFRRLIKRILKDDAVKAFKPRGKYEIFLVELFAVFYHCGRCWEHAAITAIQFLKKGVNKSVELVDFSGVRGKGRDVHAICVLDRQNDSKSDIKNFATWGGECFVVESWGRNPGCYPMEEKNVPRLAAGALDSVDYKKTKSYLRFDANFTSDDWQSVSDFLEKAKTVITAELIEELFVKSKNRFESPAKETIDLPDAKKEAADIIKQLDVQSKYYLKLAKELKVKSEMKKARELKISDNSHGVFFQNVSVGGEQPPAPASWESCCVIL